MTSPAAAPQATKPGLLPLVSVVVVNWNGYVAEGLASLGRQPYSELEVLVVDNGSTDGSPALLRTAANDRLTLIETRQNLGFAEYRRHSRCPRCLIDRRCQYAKEPASSTAVSWGPCPGPVCWATSC
jgi:glycosyl transferase family 2